ncbi:MAG: tRNA uridine-5-carboxymethylaminomethyl(34) synthesis GTPase MnmE [Clostridia bacterium]|nr:tRNA uridine-5-carboxymethylaminomethyl(34) synthesis GTPase MnmE [Clostridia bacterium]
MRLTDTIAAISTPYGKGGIAVIRISGADAIEIADRVFKAASGKALASLDGGRAVFGEIFETGRATSIDDGIATVFRAPHSFTGEDTVEISCHGGILITQRVLSAVLSAGARAAEAGEFTRRAYVSGKMDLARAEALGNLLDAESESQLLLARGGMRGILTEKTAEIYDALRSVLASIYAVIDFPDEDLADMSREQIRDVLSISCGKVAKLADTYRTARAVKEGIATVICGRTNAGKSSLYNLILGYDAAIVTDIEGTTRDILRDTAMLGKVTLRIADTAGIRATDDKVEGIGIDRALREIDSSELVLAVFDGSAPLCDEDRAIIGRLKNAGKTVIAIINKSDVGVNTSAKDEICSAFEHCMLFSATSGEGFDKLSSLVEDLFIDGEIDLASDAVVMGARQHSALVRAGALLGDTVCELDAGAPLDVCCISVEEAMSAIGEIDGRLIGEEIVSEIFSKFCVGK